MEKIAIKDSTITINVLDLDLSIKFYESIGLTLEQRWDNHYAQMIAPGITVGLHPATVYKGAKGSGNTSIGFTCEDFAVAKSALLALGITIVERNEKGGEFIQFNDPDGTALYFILPKW